MGSEIIANDILESFANPRFGDGIQVAFTQNGVNDPCILVAQLRRNYCAKLDQEQRIGSTRLLRPEADRGNIRDILPVDRSLSMERRRVEFAMRIGSGKSWSEASTGLIVLGGWGGEDML